MRTLASAVLAVTSIASCGGGDGTVDPDAIDVLVLFGGAPAGNREVSLIGSDGIVLTATTSSSGHAVAMLGAGATQATVFADSASAEGRYTMQGVVPGDHVCLGCTFQTTACATSLPQITNVRRDGGGWSWNLTAGSAYAGIELSWLPMANNPTGAGHMVTPPGATQVSTSNSLDITIKVLARADLASYDDLRTLSKEDWAGSPFCAIGAHM